MKKNEQIFLNDRPIETAREDILSRTNFSSKLANAVLEYNGKDNLVIGLYGGWGTGKTSILNLFSDYFIKSRKKNKPAVVRFNPWNFSDQNQLLHQYFNTLSITLQRKDKGEIVKNITQKIDVYSKVFMPLRLIPGLGNPLDIIEKIVAQANETLKSVGEQFDKDLTKIKQELTDLLSELKYKIIVIIDDLDRLNNIEIKQIFQLVKSIADFPNTVYVLAFDKNVVIKALSKTQEGDGNNYLEKIIQVPFEIPSLSQEKVYRYLFNELEKIKVDLQSSWKDTHWNNIFNSGIRYYFNTLRDVNRFINVFKFNFNIMREEINPADLIGITTLQIFENKIYEEIRNNKKIFAGVFNGMLAKQDKEKATEYINQLLTNYDNFKKEYLKDLLIILFPKLESILGLMKMNYPVEHLSLWEKDNLICSPEKFDVYFSLSIDENDISNSEINNILKVTNDYKKLIVEINKFKSSKKFIRFLEKLSLYIEKDIDINSIETLLKALTNVGDRYLDHQLDWYSGCMFQIFHINYYLMYKLENNRRFEMMKNMINNLTDSVYTVIYILQFEFDYHNDGKTEESKYLFTLNQLSELNELMKIKVKEFYRQGKLYNHLSLESILIWLRNNDGLEGIKEMNNQYLNSYYRLANFLHGFKGTVRSQGSGDYGYKYSYYYNLDSLKNYVDLSKLEKMARDFYKSKEFAELETEQILNIKLLLDCLDGKVKPPR